MEKMQWFKFSISEWKMGKIQRCKPEAKSAFMELCCLYWINETKLSIEDAIIECDEDNYQNLLSKKVIKEVDGYIKIYFLDEQFENVLDKSEKARESVKKRWLKRNATVLESNYESDTNVLPSNYESNTEENRIEKKIEEKNNIKDRKTSFAISLEPYLELYNREMLNNFYMYWTEHGEKDKKMRFEKEKSFDVKLRLLNWSKRSESFKQKEFKKEVLFVTPEGIEITDKLVLHVYQQTGKV